MALTIENIKIEPMKVTFGEDNAQIEKITCIADVSSSLNSQYFVMYEPDNTKHYFWYSTGAGVDPALSGATGHQITISANNSASAVASATQAVIDGLADFICTVDQAVLTVTQAANGYAKPSHDGAADTGFTFEVLEYGSSAAEVGFTDGDIEISQETSYVDVTSHQTGSEVNSQISTGSSMSVTINFKETTMEQLKKILLAEGDSKIPDGSGSGAEVFGKGTAQQFKQTFARAQKLLLHPVVLASSDLRRDITFWKAFPKVNSLTYSGENIFTIPVEFMIYPDYSKDPKINKMVFGDSTQTLT